MDKINLEDLTQDQRDVAELIGIDAFTQLVVTYGGCNLYVPKMDSLTRTSRDNEIRDRFDGYNFRELAKEYGLTEVTVRAIVTDKVRELRAKPMDGQTSLF